METLNSTTTSIPLYRTDILAPAPNETLYQNPAEQAQPIGHIVATNTISLATRLNLSESVRPQTLADVIDRETRPLIASLPRIHILRKEEPVRAIQEDTVIMAPVTTKEMQPEQPVRPSAYQGRHGAGNATIRSHRASRNKEQYLSSWGGRIKRAIGTAAMAGALAGLVPAVAAEASPATTAVTSVSTEVGQNNRLEKVGGADKIAPVTKKPTHQPTTPVETRATKLSKMKATIASYAWPTYTRVGAKGAMRERSAYAAAIAKADDKGEYIGGYDGVDCGAFVTRVMRDSGADPSYNSMEGNTYYQKKYLEQHDDVNARAGQKVLYHRVKSSEKLQPGDILIRNVDGHGHTFFYVGNSIDGLRKDKNGKPIDFKGILASASLGGRAPMASNDFRRGAFEVFRLK